MSIPSGSKFGPYEILALIGAGGMGEVYRARDARLGRDVAIKTLPLAYSQDAERLARFEREARAAGQLSHPGIVATFDAGAANGQPYIVTELLDGEDLRQRVAHEKISPRKAVEMTIAVAEALAAAHAHGIVHRDLKPENLFVTREGRVKILDFGIAKLTEVDAESAGAAITQRALTGEGVAVGTPAYMSPEQVRGERVDHRTDIFALGAILYELLSGTRAFRGDSRVATMNAVLVDDPPDLPETVSPGLRRLVRRCLEKRPDDRFQSARDLAFALDAMSDSGTSQPAISAGPLQGARQYWTIIAAAGCIALAVIVIAQWMRTPDAVAAVSRRLTIPRPTGTDAYSFALSRDGSRIIYGNLQPGGTRLYSRRLDEFETTALLGSQPGRLPFFSPDGNSFAYTWNRKLMKGSVAGGSSIELADVGTLMWGDWGDDGQMVLSQREQGLTIVPEGGGPLQAITTPDAAAGEVDHHTPFFLPGGRAVLFTIHAGPEIFRIAVKSLDTGVQKTLIDDGFSGRYVSTGHLVFARGSSLFAVPFDPIRLELKGAPLAVVERVMTVTSDGLAMFAVADDGTLAFTPADKIDERRLVSIDREGLVTNVPAPPRAYQDPQVSPDGRRLAIAIQENQQEHIWLYDLGTGALTRLTSGGYESRPSWHPDGQHIVFAARIKDERHLIMQSVDAGSEGRSLVSSRDDLWPSTWSGDGSTLYYVVVPPTSITSIRRIRTDRAEPSEVVFEEPVGAPRSPAIAPAGGRMVYVATVAGRNQLYMRSIDGGTSRQITVDGGDSPRWSHDGNSIFFRNDGSLWRMPVQNAPEFRLGRPEKLFETDYVDEWGRPQFDLSPDGNRFIFIRRGPEEVTSRPIHIVENWFAELRARSPIRN